MTLRPICPSCGDDSAIAKVTGIVTSQSGTTFTSSTSRGSVSTPLVDVIVRDRPAVRQNIETSTSSSSSFSSHLAAVLSSQYPTPPDYRPIYNLLYFGSIAVMAIVVSWAFILILAWFGIAQRFYGPNVHELAWALFPVFLFFIFHLTKYRHGRVMRRVISTYQKRMSRYKQALANWDSAFYCSRHDVVFLTGDMRTAAPTRLAALL